MVMSMIRAIIASDGNNGSFYHEYGDDSNARSLMKMTGTIVL